MKHLLILIASVLLFSCKKTEPINQPTQDLYYKIIEYSLDGKTSESPIKHINVNGVNQAVSDEGDDDDDDDDDDDHTTCPIKIETISITQSGNNVVIYWEAENEDNVNYYEVQKSTDALNYKQVTTKNVSSNGKYKVIDLIK